MACKITNSFAIKKIFHPTFSKTYKKIPFLLHQPPRQSPNPEGREWEKNEHSFSGFFPNSSSHHRAIALTSPSPEFLFSSTPPCLPPQNKQHSLLVLPSVNAIINFATKFFEMLTKKQSEHSQKVFQVFQVFRVFQVFHVRFWTIKPPCFGPNPNKPEKSVPTHLRHIMGAENSQKGNSPTGLRTRCCPVC